MKDNQITRCGVGVLIMQDEKILLGKRRGSFAAGSYGSGGGHLDFGESCKDAVVREIREEAGVELKDLEFLCVSNFIIESKHYIDISFTAKIKSGEPQVMEPEKLDDWDWYDINNPPAPLLGCVANYLDALKTGRKFFDLNENE
jgi:8-oxo-dGTP diphosphatase